MLRALVLFRRHVVAGTHSNPRHLGLGSVRSLGNAEVRNPHLTGITGQNVRGFDVPMHQPMGMGGFHALQDLVQQCQALLQGQCPGVG